MEAPATSVIRQTRLHTLGITSLVCLCDITRHLGAALFTTLHWPITAASMVAGLRGRGGDDAHVTDVPVCICERYVVRYLRPTHAISTPLIICGCIRTKSCCGTSGATSCYSEAEMVRQWLDGYRPHPPPFGCCPVSWQGCRADSSPASSGAPAAYVSMTERPGSGLQSRLRRFESG